MATLKQACEIIDDVMRLPSPTARWHAQRLQSAGIVPTNPGVPAQVPAEDVAAVLLSALVGSSFAPDFIDLRMGSGGPTLAAVLGSFLERPRELIEVTIDKPRLEAAISFTESDGTVQRISFYPETQHLAPAYDCTIRINGDAVQRLRQAIAEAPPVRAGRPSTRRKINRTYA